MIGPNKIERPIFIGIALPGLSWASNASLNSNSGIFSALLGVIFIAWLIITIIKTIWENPIRGTLKVLSYTAPVLIIIAMPIAISIKFDLSDGWFILIWLTSFWIAGLYIEIHGKYLFPEDNNPGSNKDGQ